MALKLDVDMGFATLNYVVINKQNPYTPLPEDIFQQAVKATDTTSAIPEIKGAIQVNLAVCQDKEHNNAQSNWRNPVVSMDAFYTLMAANNNDILGCLYTLLKQRADFAEAADILDTGQTVIKI